MILPGSSELLVAVNLEDPESVVALQALMAWPQRAEVAVKVLPFIKKALNTAADVPKGNSGFEAFKLRRSDARRRYQHQEKTRNLQRLGRSMSWDTEPSGMLRSHDALAQLGDKAAPFERIFAFVFGLLKDATLIDEERVDRVLDATGLRSEFGLVEATEARMQSQLIEISERLESLGMLSAPSLLFREEAYLGYGHLPQITHLIEAV